MIKPLAPLTLPTPRPRTAGAITIGDAINMAPAGSAIRVDLWGMVLDGRVSAYLDRDTALRFATELARLARAAQP